MPARNPMLDPDPLNGQVSERVRTQRQQRGWSLEQLAATSGVSRSMLSQIERGEANPTLAVTCKIAQAFGMSLAEFVDVPGAGVAIHVVRSDDRAALYRSDENCEIRTLSPLHLEKDVEFYQVRLKPGGALTSAPHFQGTREFLTVEQGKIRVTSGTERSELNRGDSASYRADVPHVLENLGKSDATVFLVVIYQ
ncbi:MAG TPA: XRE family transcriptional regulator [Planctomycetaceae bacterium]|nr:XRE family transcriptional regulator [Planctomycetaceae bacterium]